MTHPLNISDWSVDKVEASVVTERFEALQQDRAVYALTISANRDIGYYVWKILLPIALIVAMSWCVFWIDPKQFGTQNRIVGDVFPYDGSVYLRDLEHVAKIGLRYYAGRLHCRGHRICFCSHGAVIEYGYSFCSRSRKRCEKIGPNQQNWLPDSFSTVLRSDLSEVSLKRHLSR